MTTMETKINAVLVHLFNDALQLEEDTLRKAGITLTIREVHILEAICAAGENNTMSALASKLHITVGSLTVAINTLERKGYVTRQRSLRDKRCIHVLSTEKARDTEKIHQAYHLNMTRAMMTTVPQEQLDTVLEGLEATWSYFTDAIKEEHL